MHTGCTTGIVLGIDVGFSETARTTCFCTLEWNHVVAAFRFGVTISDAEARRRALIELVGSRELLAVAVDGPLTRGLRLVAHYRSAEALLSRGVLQKRGKPGQTSAPVGQKLHFHATQLAELALECVRIAASAHGDAIHAKCIVEAFPNMYLAALIDEHALPPLKRDATDRYWEVLVHKSDRLLRVLAHLLPRRHLQNELRSIADHEQRAGVICALTALSVAMREYVCVGDSEDGDIVLPPRAMWGAGVRAPGAWLEAELRANLPAVRQARKAHMNHKRARIIVNCPQLGT